MLENNQLYYFLPDVLIWVSLAIALGAQIFVKLTYKKFAQVKNKKNLTGAVAAQEILAKNQITDIKITATTGFLSDYYDPQKKVIVLSKDIFAGTSVAAIAVAAHECGHVIQDKNGFSFLRLRNSLVPFISFSSYAGYIAILIGLLFANSLFWVGILFELAILFFQIITLPVEFDASARALAEIKSLQLLKQKEEIQGAKVLQAAAWTYVASVATALLQILRLILIFNRRRD